MRHRLVWLAATATVVVFGVAGVVAWQPWQQRERSGPLLLVGEDPRVHVFDGDAIFPAELGAALPVSYDPHSRCLYVLHPDNQRHLAIWPTGSRPVTETGRPGVRVPEAGLIVDGSSVTHASVAVGSLSDQDSAYADVAAALRTLDTCSSGVESFTIFYSITTADRPIP